MHMSDKREKAILSDQHSRGICPLSEDYSAVQPGVYQLIDPNAPTNNDDDTELLRRQYLQRSLLILSNSPASKSKR